jgi:two-component system, response regulator PdtaR
VNSPAGSANSAKLEQRIKRVLIIESSRNNAKMLAEIVRSLGATEIYIEIDGDHAWDRLTLFDPNLIFCEYSDGNFKGTAFVRKLRRSSSRSRKVPVVMMSEAVTKSMLDEARDTGVDEFMLKPYARRDVERRAAAVLLNARPWIEAVDYIGPDRRRFNSSEYKGAKRRKADSKAPVGNLEQAVRIFVSSVGKLNEDRPQALRSILVQLEVIVPAMRVTAATDPKIKEALSMIISELKTAQASQSVLEPFAAILADHLGIDLSPLDKAKTA